MLLKQLTKNDITLPQQDLRDMREFLQELKRLQLPASIVSKLYGLDDRLLLLLAEKR
jgi:hypothetical protein